MKAMAAELNMYQAQVNEYKYEIERLTRELGEMKRNYYELKKRDGLVKTMTLHKRATSARLPPLQTQRETTPRNRFTGGGFPLLS